MFDSHIHYANDMGAERMIQVFEENNYDGAALLCIGKDMKGSSVDDAFALKEECLKRNTATEVVIFGGYHYDIYGRCEGKAGALADELIKETERLLARGCQGIKFVEGKPNMRKMYPIPDFDSEEFEPYWAMAEETGLPIVFHVNDPEEFWTIDTTIAKEELEFRRRSGWLYDETYVNNEDQYRQFENVLKRHSRLKLLFPHFFFMSKQLPRLSDWLDRFENMMIDVTPGIELYLNLSANIEEARAFFTKYKNRICYGTDTGGRQILTSEPTPLNMEESTARIKLVQGFLNSKEDYVLEPNAYFRGPDPKVIHGFMLPEEVKKGLYGENFLRFIQKHK